MLTPPTPMQFAGEAGLLAQLRPGMDGLIIEDVGRRALFLPSVWEELPDQRQFLTALKLKAGHAGGSFFAGVPRAAVPVDRGEGGDGGGLRRGRGAAGMVGPPGAYGPSPRWIISISARRSRKIPPRVWPWSHIRWPSLDRKVTSWGGGEPATRTIWLTRSSRCRQYSGVSLVTCCGAGDWLATGTVPSHTVAAPRLSVRAMGPMPARMPPASSRRRGAGMTTTLATLGRFFVSRQRQDRDQPRGCVGQAEAAAVQLRDRLHQRQSKPGARRVAGALAAKEPLGGARPVRFRNAGALVGHRDLHAGGVSVADSRTALPGGENFTALSTRLATACWISSRSPNAGSRRRCLHVSAMPFSSATAP